MTIDKNTEIWLVTDPSPLSEFDDVCYKTDLVGLENIMMSAAIGCKRITEENLTIYTDDCEAIKDAQARMENKC